MMPSNTPAIPEGMHTITPHIVLRNAAQAIDFYKKAFGAEELGRSLTPDGKIMHAMIRIGDSLLMMNDEFPNMGCSSAETLGGTNVTLHIQTEDVDSLFDRAVKAGAKATMPVADQFWGDRYGQVVDPFGQRWSLATRVEQLTPDEVEARAKAFFAKAG
ncbi:MAG TPA: VOC family protein [Terriglobales bacterium]|jgi:PhnB protein|nr:VOC family protein [Terriglobales bacterium]